MALQYAFQITDATAVQLNVFNENVATKQCYEKVGFAERNIALHRAFEERKLTMVNHRREFFNVTLDEIKKVINDNFDRTVEFVDVPDAEQYRISEKMRTNMLAN